MCCEKYYLVNRILSGREQLRLLLPPGIYSFGVFDRCAFPQSFSIYSKSGENLGAPLPQWVGPL